MTVFLALTEGAETMPAATRFACRLAKRMDATLHGFTAMPDPAGALLMTGAGTGLYMAAGASVIASVEEAQEKARTVQEKAFRELCTAEGVAEDKLELSHVTGAPEQEIGRVALLGDALVFPHDCARSHGPYGSAFEYTLMGRRQPVVIAGENENPDLSTMLIAWDGSPEAARAIRLHEKVICSADRVVIAQNTDKIDPQDMKGPEDPANVRDWLEARDVATTMRTFSGDIADGLLRLCEEENAGVLVAGAFGHSRMEEFIFGGVSRSLLRSDNGPALALSH